MKCSCFLFFVFILGFSLGDELGFKESISSQELNRRRSAQASNFIAQTVNAQQQQQQQKQQNNANISVRSANIASQYDAKPKASTVPPFKPIPPAPEHAAIIKPNVTRYTKKTQRIPEPAIVGMVVPEFNAIPASINTVPIMKKSSHVIRNPGPLPPATINEINSLPSAVVQQYLLNNNISENAIEALKQKITTTTTTTTPRPTKRSNIANMGKVMNAPREYYPVGYDKNFDDNFASRVELPETSFYCGDQKHFPGLYADEDLGCMVFHVCALTDEGLIMKSFLCPESTLFDQTILKCNWWFYVDCKNSKKLYDSNIPISKSYQLMKALTFFSQYKQESNSASQNVSSAKDKD